MNKSFYIDVYNVTCVLSIIIVIEIFKTAIGQPIKDSLFNIIFYSMLVCEMTHDLIRKLVVVFILWIQLFEIGTWYFYSMPINSQALSSIDINFVFDPIPSTRKYILAIIFIPFLLASLPFKKKYKRISSIYLYNSSLLLIVAVYYYIVRFQNNLQTVQSKPFTKHDSELSDVDIRFMKFVATKPRVIKTLPKLKNLIMLQLESFEINGITEIATPFLYNLTQKYAYVNNILGLPYTTWTTAGTLITQCNIPQIISDMRIKSRCRDPMSKYNILPCLPDFLRILGYELLYSGIGYDRLMGLYDWIKYHGYKRYIHVNSGDHRLFNRLNTKEFIETYNKLGEKERFAHFIVTTDSHGPYLPKKGCVPEDVDEPPIRQNFNCVDQVIRKFVQKYLDLNMNRHTLMIIYSDHLQPGNFLPEPRRLFFLFPGMEKRKFRQNVTYHDFAPTILDELGIKEYEPRFPFGSNVFKSENYTYAEPKDLALIYDILVKKFNFKKITHYICHTRTNEIQNNICNVTNQ